MEKAKFTMIDEDFICEVCGHFVKHLGYTARDHCPKCLCSKHVDNNPGDRQALCCGILVPIDVEKMKKDSFKIIYQCQKCGVVKKNKVALDDDMDKIIEVMAHDF